MADVKLEMLKKNRRIYEMLAALRWHGGRLLMCAFHAVGRVRPGRVFFSSFAGRDYSDSPARVCEALHALRPDAEMLWLLKDPRQAPAYVRTVKPHSLKALWAISTARCLVDDFNRPKYMLKFGDQFYVQTWHGDRPFKKIMYDMQDGQLFPDGEQMDLAVAGSAFGERLYRTAFRYSGEVMQQGMPRNDALVSRDPEAASEIRRRLGIGEDVGILLYAPTFRNALVGESHPASFDLCRALDRLESVTGKPWRCLTRAHSESLRVDGTADGRVRDVTAWPETTELLLASDLLITDYSSIAGDYVLLDRPVILYQPDLDAYAASERGFYFDMRSCPYARAESEEALFELLDDLEALIPRCAEVRRFFGIHETGASAQAVAEWISQRLM